MESNFQIKNFRVFGNDAVSFNLKPITILTGENSSGKSTVVKAMALLRNYFNAIMKDPARNPAAVQLDFSDPQLKIAGFDSAINFLSDKDAEMVFSFDTTSNYAPFPFNLEYSFVQSKDNPSKGDLKTIKLFYEENCLLTANNDEGHLVISEIDFENYISKMFLYFVKAKSYRDAKKTCKSEDEPEIVVNATNDGIDVTSWQKYDLRCFDFKDFRNNVNHDKNLTKAILKFEENGLLFYNPVISEYVGMSKSSCLEKMKDSSLSSSLSKYMSEEEFSSLKEYFVNQFESSSKDNILDFLLEEQAIYLRSIVLGPIGLDSFYGVTTYIDAIANGVFYENGCQRKDYCVINQKKFNNRSCQHFLNCLQFDKSEDTSDFYKFTTSSYDDMGVFQAHFAHYLTDAFGWWFNRFLNEVLITNKFDGFAVITNSFTQVQRLQSYEDKSGFVQTIKNYQSFAKAITRVQRDAQISRSEDTDSTWAWILKDIKFKPGSIVNKWLDKMGIANSLLIKEDVDGLGFKLFLQHSNDITSLADEGHGITQIVSILLQIETAIMKQSISGHKDVNSITTPEVVLAIEEPEVSLHPSLQSQLADIFLDAKNHGINLIIETHSEYLIRRTQALIAGYSSKEEFDRRPFVVYYINRDGSTYELEYSETGRFKNSFGPGFFDEASRSNVEILKRERRMRDGK